MTMETRVWRLAGDKMSAAEMRKTALGYVDASKREQAAGNHVKAAGLLMRIHFPKPVIASAAWQSRSRRNRHPVQRDRRVATLLAMTNRVRVSAGLM